MQVDTLVFQGAPQPLNEDIVEEPAFPIHPLPVRALRSNVPRGEIRTPERRSRSVQAKDVNWDP